VQTLSSSRRRALVPLIAGVLVLALFGAACGPQQQELRSQVNRERTARGIAALADAGDLTSKAQSHATTLASQQTLAHSDLRQGVSGSWTTVGENVGYASTVQDAHAALMSSASHRDNILSGRYTHLGTGAAQGSNGLWYVVEEFAG
jgi:uncharacterized protein YkwD